MSRYLLDTTVLIDFSKRREPAFSFVHDAIEQGDELGVSPINVAEFFSGIPADYELPWTAFIQTLLFWPASLDAARQAGRFRHDFARQGIQLPMTDALIAAVALEHDATVVTRNVKDYPFPALRLLAL